MFHVKHALHGGRLIRAPRPLFHVKHTVCRRPVHTPRSLFHVKHPARAALSRRPRPPSP